MLALVTLSGTVVSLSWDGSNVWRFGLIAFLAGAMAAALATTKTLDGIAMLLGMLAGVGVTWVLTAGYANLLDGGLVERIRALPRPVIDALVRDDVTELNRNLTADSLLSLTIWMSSWIAMWMLLRVGFVVLALVPPAVLILANEHFTGDDRGWPLVLMVALAILVVVHHRMRDQHQRWAHHRVLVSDSIPGKVLVSGLAIAVVVSSTLVMSPAAWSQTVLQPLVTGAIDKFETARIEAEFWFDDVLGTDLAPEQVGRYTEFADGYSVGGPLNLSDQPEVVAQVDTASAPYLTARSYDFYTGRGWTSSASGEFADGRQSVRQSPELLYNPNWEVALSPEARNERMPTNATITMLGPGSNVVLSVDSFLTADVQTVVRMSWTTVSNMPLALDPSTLNQLPPDVQLLASLLLQSQLNGDQTAWGPAAASGEMQAAIDAEVDDLASRGIEVRWAATPDGLVQTLYVTGRLPVFDDVEAVFHRQAAPAGGNTYTVRGLTSFATPEQLTAVQGEYPPWVTERYLQTGDTITDRTRQLTGEIIGSETNPYNQAVLIEQWLRTNIAYDEKVNAPPRGQDLVDYTLFDNRRGYCEHYSAAMAVMLRSLGIPARVVVGYSPGERDPQTGGWLYLQSNAHAWVEAYFPGYGWIPFEPTAARPLGEFDVEPVDPANADGMQTPEVAPTVEPVMPTAAVSTPDIDEDNTEATPAPTEADDTLAPPTVLPDDSASGPPRWLVSLGTVTAIVAAGIGGGWLLWQRGLRGMSPSAGLMKRVHRVGGWLGIHSDATTTPREYARKFDESANAIAGPVRRITRTYEVETFGPASARNQLIDDARTAWREIRGKALYLLRHRKR
jgi:transglutaminase-like putative cysteine protease